MKPGKMVIVEWRDAYTIDDWTSIAELEKEESGKLAFTGGFLVKRSSEGVVVAGSVSEDGEACSTIFIPKPFIRSIKEVSKG